MKIAMFDPYLYKFTGPMVEWWRAQGHEVKTDRYYDPELVEWGDLIWWDTCDNNLLSATSPGDAILGHKFFDNREIPWDIHQMDLTGKKLVCRPIDIEVWGGSHAHAEMWDLIDHCIFIAPHIRDEMMRDSRPQSSNMTIHTIPHSVSPDKWTFKKRGPGKDIAIVSEIWESKGIDYALQIALKLKPLGYRFHWIGKRADYIWHEAYRQDFIKRNELPITFTDWVDDLDEWLDDKNYLLHCSIKEAFSAATAEAMAKGIKPILHHFYGAEYLWPGMTWQSIDEAFDMITDNNYDSQNYLDYLYEKGYTTDQMMTKIMDTISG